MCKLATWKNFIFVMDALDRELFRTGVESDCSTTLFDNLFFGILKTFERQVGIDTFNKKKTCHARVRKDGREV